VTYVVDLADVSASDLSTVGGKAGKLGELVREGLPVPPGFVLTTAAYQAFVDATALKKEIPSALESIRVDQPSTAEAAAQRIRAAFESAPYPAELRKAITEAYESFVRKYSVRFAAVRSSATAEDLEGASFAGLQDTYSTSPAPRTCSPR
jgi:phosphoenolpyruvate synthase/pyruvate phosphate dikinase